MPKPKVAIAGASGFIGKWFIDTYHEKYDIVALSRSEVIDSVRSTVEWRMVDMYSLSSTKNALEGADYALYLVHSMAPSTRLNQSTFEDTDLLLADNFSRAAEEVGLKQIIFIGGILPKETTDYSRHLQSRYETESTLGSRSTPLTALRAGIVIGPGGSSFRILEKLVARLPVMACPKWCMSPSQPIDIRDMLEVIDNSFGNKQTYGRAIEIGGPEVITYMDLLRLTAKQLSKKRIIFDIPFFTLTYSKFWVGLFSDSSPTFVSPLIESLRHDISLEADDPNTTFGKRTLKESIFYALTGDIPIFPRRKPLKKEKNTVRSVQRLPNPANKSTAWVANEYPNWLSQVFIFLLKASVVDNLVRFKLFGICLLELEYIEDRSDEKRQLYYITGGKLVKRIDYGWLEFRSVLENRFIISAVHEFVPRLPWIIYKSTQAVVHLWVMNAFGNYLRKL